VETTNQRRIVLVGIIGFAVLETGIIWWRIDAAPLAWICLLWTLVLWVLHVLDYRRAAVAIWINLGAVLVSICIVEGTLYIAKAANPYLLPPGVRFVGDLARPNYFIVTPSAGLGYRPRPGMRIVAEKRSFEQIIYKVTYSVGADGLRISPPAAEPPRGCVLVFGDSISWGEGVNDEQTFPYQIGYLTRGDIAVTNFAFTGYSAHQMLWQLEHGIVSKAAKCDKALPVLVVYQTVTNNVGRVAGLRGYDRYGPRYVLVDGGAVEYRGSFNEGEYIWHDRVFIPGAISDQLNRTNIFSRILGGERRLDAFDLARFSAVIKAAKDRIGDIFPRSKFVVLVWPDPINSDLNRNSVTSLLFRSLIGRDLATINANDVVPGLRDNPAATTIPGDGHPNADTHSRIARYLVSVFEDFAGQKE
jgi:hypothetical protein